MSQSKAEPNSSRGILRNSANLCTKFCLALLFSATVTACTKESVTPQDEWSQPAWFAEQARQREEVAQYLQDCVDSKGWNFAIDEYGGVAEDLSNLGDARETLREDIFTCIDELPEKYAVTIDEAYLHDVLYPQQVDVYNCLVAQGITPEPPPPVDVWVENYLAQDDESAETDLWLAWDDPWMSEFAADPNHSYDDLLALDLVCPQPYTAPNATSG